MEEHLNVGPYLFQMFLTRYFHHAVQHREHPGRYAADIGDVLVHRFTGYELALYLKVAQQGCLLLGYAHQVDQRIDVLYQNGTEVAHQRTCYIIVRRMTATKNQSLAVEHSRLGVVAEIQRYRVASTSIVNLLQTFVADRDELRLVVCGT